MSTAIVLFTALLHSAAAAPATSFADRRTHHLERRLDTGSKIALGICVPAVTLVLVLGIGILWFYPEQRRKLREQNARRELHAANARHGQRRGSEHATLPVYKEHEGSDHEMEDVVHGHVPAAPSPPTGSAAITQHNREHAALPSTDARHAALTV